ncbi:hypothetical protein FB45DRAFT_899439 [Roridomyces roridus]|uniref:F-box domain-containing protein n=1 Tax=Roridomyces roridus TaxID=1738132 RepID=A0AAD7FV70_9AGAR|nr:hypothetical protein FB45DRAFT_899439 [Roridomyces roridus]
MATDCPTCSFQGFVPQQILSAQEIAHLRELLRANAQPPDSLSLESTLFELKAELQRCSAELGRYDTEIARLDAASWAVVGQKSAVSTAHATVMSLYQVCNGLRAPIRRLPVEILNRIFQMSSKPYSDPVAVWSRNFAALAPLFTLSQVCARWHDICSGQLPLDVVLQQANGSDLLMDQSYRWRSAVLSGRAADPYRLSKHSMPLLESLELLSDPFQALVPHPNGQADFLTVAPKLTRLVVSGPLLDTIPTHLSQLRVLECVAVDFQAIAEVLRLISGLSAGSTLRLRMVSDRVRSPPTLHPRPSDIQTLAIKICDFTFNSIVGYLMSGLALPRLQTLVFRSLGPLLWPHAPFLALSSRSSFSEHLISLNLWPFAITSAELVQFVSSLRDGEPQLNGGREDPLLTDALLSDLTGHSSSQPLPSLRRFTCHESRLAFTDSVLLDFISSRCRSDDAPAFECSVFWLGGYQRDLDPDVEAQLQELRGDGALVWVFAAEKAEEQDQDGSS